MPLVGTSLGHQQHLRAIRAAEISGHVVGVDPEFLNALDGCGDCCLRCDVVAVAASIAVVTRQVVRSVASVNRVGILVGHGARHLPACGVSFRPAKRRRGVGLVDEERGRISVGIGKRLKSVATDNGSHGGVRGLELRPGR